jgi:hypothetical protein
VPEAQREPLFDADKLAGCFDREAFERDGFCVWPGVVPGLSRVAALEAEFTDTEHIRESGIKLMNGRAYL